jgi:hypothetical protein
VQEHSHSVDAAPPSCGPRLGRTGPPPKLVREPGRRSEPRTRTIVLRHSGPLQLWAGKGLAEDDQRFLDAARTQVPTYALFQRLQLSPEDQRAQDDEAIPFRRDAPVVEAIMESQLGVPR